MAENFKASKEKCYGNFNLFWSKTKLKAKKNKLWSVVSNFEDENVET